MDNHLNPISKRFWPVSASAILLAVVWVFMLGCASMDNRQEWAPLKTSVEALYLNYHELRTLHSDLHAAALAHIESSGPELSEIQSAARFIQQANLIAFYQWELLSITHYIRESALRDFYTLRERDLLDAQNKSNDLIMAVRVYDAFVHDQQASKLIAACIQCIEQHIALYGQMVDELRILNGQSGTDKNLPPTAGEV